MSNVAANPSDSTASERPAVVLVSGGLDSATTLAVARRDGFAVHAVSFDYGQRHRWELRSAEAVCRQLGVVDHRTIALDLRQIGGSALTADIDVPRDRDEAAMAAAIPVTYVPARNTIFLSIAMGWAETIGASDLFAGVNSVDYSGYPDCRPEFVAAFESLANLATATGVGGTRWRVRTPLIDLTKAEIIRLGTELGVDFSLTHSCYDPDAAGRACGRCDSCRLRAAGFRDAGVADPTVYVDR